MPALAKSVRSESAYSVLVLGASAEALPVITDLQQHGYSVCATSLGEARRALVDFRPFAVLVVTARISREVLSLCEALRSDGFGFGLVLLSSQVERSEVLAALDAGVDECSSFPLDVELLSARLLGIARRSAPSSERPADSSLRLLPDDTARVAYVGSQKVRLTPIEAKILTTLRDAHGSVVTGQRLRYLACPASPLSPQSLQVHIAHLRGKLGPDGPRITNCRALGYRLARPVASEAC